MKEKSEQESAAEETDETEETDRAQSPEDGDRQSPDSDEQDADETDELGPNIDPVRRKIGEGRDNLRRRADWFQRRTGTGK